MAQILKVYKLFKIGENQLTEVTNFKLFHKPH